MAGTGEKDEEIQSRAGGLICGVGKARAPSGGLGFLDFLFFSSGCIERRWAHNTVGVGDAACWFAARVRLLQDDHDRLTVSLLFLFCGGNIYDRLP